MDDSLTILLEPNSETLQAIYELENNVNVSRYNHVDELKKISVGNMFELAIISVI